ncbi:hypothetical protein J5N97_015838 [Dioscorea zingiberensis]|uniref:UDP-glycosyltransferase n=1 Tax=Dioscorea zingiberensis TaxID=325984 RepID=A0A9D5CI99_9LILI|nr:hypothetical protein J5N97_015838 [Dioscorea zingiberensis]
MLSGQRLGKPAGLFWAEDTTCKVWLDEQDDNSVIYVAFGSLAVLNERQMQELALGLELTGRPFLWVVRPDITAGKTIMDLPKGLEDRIGDRGMVVQWSPQQEVLAHPAVSCFMSHCGWNSTMEGVSNGVPFLCWPYFADQHLNQTYICDVWKTGLKMVPDENNMITKEQIKDRVEELLGDGEMKKRALTMKEIAIKGVERGGSSFENFNTFVSAMQEDLRWRYATSWSPLCSSLCCLERESGKSRRGSSESKILADGLNQIKQLSVNMTSTETNMVYFNILESSCISLEKICEVLEEHGVLAMPTSATSVRLVLHHQISVSDVHYALTCIKDQGKQFFERTFGCNRK